jgi:hypothetical protein
MARIFADIAREANTGATRNLIHAPTKEKIRANHDNPIQWSSVWRLVGQGAVRFPQW